MSYELQLIDTNCNDCKFMVRDFEKFEYWKKIKKEQAHVDFLREKEKAIADALNAVDEKSRDAELRVATKKYSFFQFDTSGLVSYGSCSKFDKSVAFISVTCMPQNQNCFTHRKPTTF